MTFCMRKRGSGRGKTGKSLGGRRGRLFLKSKERGTEGGVAGGRKRVLIRGDRVARKKSHHVQELLDRGNPIRGRCGELVELRASLEKVSIIRLFNGEKWGSSLMKRLGLISYLWGKTSAGKESAA